MRIPFAVLLLATLPFAMPLRDAHAQSPAAHGTTSLNTPVGKWRTIDDKTGKVKSIVEIYQTTNGTLAGKVLQVLDSDKGPHPLCDACTGDNHNKPIEGMVIAWNLQHEGDTWDDGKIMDPKNGKIYSAKMTPTDNGKKLQVRGYMGFSLLGRSQTWIRDE